MSKKKLITITGDFHTEKIWGSDVTFVNPFSYLQVIDRPEFDIERFKVFADGIAVVSLYNIFLGQQVKRFAFDNTSVAPLVFRFAEQRNLKLFLVGGKEGIAKKAAALFVETYPLLNIIGAEGGYFDSIETRENALQRAASADIVVVGMGAPYQEIFLETLRAQKKWQGTGFTCGGFLEQTANKGMVYFPAWIDKLHLRWAYRLWDEPKRLGERYLLEYPKFLVYFLKRCIQNLAARP